MLPVWLDWFWRGWFYSTDHTDIGIGDVTLYELDSSDPKVEKPKAKARRERDNPTTIYAKIEKGQPTRLDQYPDLADFYNSYDEFGVTWQDEKAYKDKLENDPKERDGFKVNAIITLRLTTKAGWDAGHFGNRIEAVKRAASHSRRNLATRREKGF